ncbi:MAG: LysR family transcriptional regulator [Hyphomicrobiaceae bacterium]|jgi:DNA-binding transcriptional LysR family regulator
MRSLNLDQLRALLRVVELGSFSAAARQLNLTQPAVSLQIRELERRFGVRLIERLGKRAHTTAPGATLVEAARRIFHECDLIDAAMRPYRDGWIGRVQIGATNTMLVHVLPPILRELSREHPGIDLHVTNMPTRESVERILQNRLDLALVTLPVQKRHLRITPLLPEQLVAIFPAGTRDLPDEVTPEFAARQPLLMEHTGGAVYALVVRWLSGLGSLPRPPMHLGTIEALRSAVASNLGMSIVPEIVVAGHAPGIIVRPLRPQLSRTLALIEHRNKPNEPALEIVRNALLALRTNRDTGIDRKRRGPEESPAALRARRSTRRPRRNSALT